jgi:hydroxymethylbilane synthase
LKVGTRGSSLALAQTKAIITDLSKYITEKIDIEIIKTTGDKIKDSQLYNIDAKGIFTKELDTALLEEKVDFTVHSFKDLPTEMEEELTIAAIPVRESPLEVLVSKHKWNELPEGATLGTSSLRREAFCKLHNKELNIKPIRGNIGTRVNKVLNGAYDATIMAEAGLNRLGISENIKERFSIDYITPAAGQGALAVVTRKNSPIIKVLDVLNHYPSVKEVIAEKKVLEELGFGCQWPIGVCARSNGDLMDLTGILLNNEGEILSHVNVRGPLAEAEEIGKQAAKIMGDDYS